MWASSGSSEMTTAEAWTEACRVQPSSALATSQSARTSPCVWTASASCGLLPSASSSVMFSGKFGTSLAIRSTSVYGMLSTRPTSRIAAFAPIVPKVMMWATRSRPYFSAT